MQETCILQIIITDKEKKQAPQRLSENELRKLSDKELDKYCSKLIKEIVESYKEVEEYQ